MSFPSPPSPVTEIIADAIGNPASVLGEVHHWPSKSLNATYIDPSDFYVAYKPFDLQGRPFEELPESSQRFLVTTGLYPRQFENIGVFFRALLDIRTARRHRLERTLEGVSRAIVREMLGSHFRTGNGVLDERCKATLRDVLQPEWREHLDSYVEEIDALLWLDMIARVETSGQPSWEQYMTERRCDIESMVDFALQCLQNALDRVRMETKAQWLLEEITRKDKDEGRISEIIVTSSDSSDVEEGQWVEISETNDIC